MTELKKKVMEDAGINADQAALAVNTVLTYLKSKSPKALHAHLDKMAAGDTLEDTIKESIQDATGDAKDKTVEALRKLADAAETAVSKLKHKVDEISRK